MKRSLWREKQDCCDEIEPDVRPQSSITATIKSQKNKNKLRLNFKDISWNIDISFFKKTAKERT